MPPAVILGIFDLIMALEKNAPGIIDSIARIKEKGVTDENIAAERAALAADFDTSDPLGRVPDPSAPTAPQRPGFDPSAPGPVN